MLSTDDALSFINSKKVLVVEGKDEINFFDAILKHIGITDIVIREVGGKGQFRKKLPALVKARGFSPADGSPFVTHLAIIRDKKHKKSCRLCRPTQFFILPIRLRSGQVFNILFLRALRLPAEALAKAGG